jgi:hypothetical protein
MGFSEEIFREERQKQEAASVVFLAKFDVTYFAIH